MNKILDVVIQRLDTIETWLDNYHYEYEAKKKVQMPFLYVFIFMEKNTS